MRRLLSILTLLGLLVAAVMPAAAGAEGIIVPPEPRFPTPVLKQEKINIRITDQVAITTVDQTFVNESDVECEGTYLFPLPAGAVVSNFNMKVDGQTLEGKIIEKDEARSRYEEIVRQRRDPALLEYIGDNLFQASIYPIPPHAERKIHLEYTTVLEADQGLVSYIFPLHGAVLAGESGDLVITADIETSKPLQAVYSPLAGVAVTKDGDTRAHVSYEGSLERSGDFILYYTFTDADLGLNLLSYKTSVDDGFFLMLVSPPPSVDTSDVVARDIVLVLDTSGSMEGEKIEQAKEAAEFVLGRLNPDDRFNIIAFSDVVNPFAKALQPVDKRDAALNWVENIYAGGGTAINDALLAGVDQVSATDRLSTIIFLTDGLPTVGEEDIKAILGNVAQKAPETVRFFNFGVGYDVNTLLLDQLAQDHHGTADYVLPEESIEDKVSRFYAKIGKPVLTDLSIDFGSADVYDVYPGRLSDLFEGTQLLVTGRYRGSATTSITLEGRAGEEERTFEFREQEFTDFDTANSFIPRLWAGRKIGFLLSELKLKGENEELINEVTNLSLRYGIITPYTSYFVEEDNGTPAPIGEPGAPSPMDFFGSLQESTGAEAVASSKTANDLAASETVQSGHSDAVRTIRDKTFVLRDEVWTDTGYDGKSSVKEISFGSPEYFELVTADPSRSAYFSAGENMLVVLDGQAYRIAGSGDSVPDDTNPVVTPAPDESASRESVSTIVAAASAGIVGIGGVGIVLLRRKGTEKNK